MSSRRALSVLWLSLALVASTAALAREVAGAPETEASTSAGDAPAAPAVDLTGADDIRDIRGPLPEPAPLRWPMYLAIAVAAAALAYAGHRGWRAYRARPRHARAIALEQIDTAGRAARDGTLASPAFADALTGAVRDYIAARFALPASQRTTEEIAAELATRADELPVLVPHRDALAALLARCDLAKYAARPLPSEEMSGLADAARALVDSTHRALAEAERPRRGRRTEGAPA